jgi:hypothetical protein|nr:MAG TPA: type I neck protein [Caudoviricetes sp.]
MIEMSFKGDFDTSKWLQKVKDQNLRSVLSEAGSRGLTALQAATPEKTGKTARSWAYKTIKTGRGIKIVWYNTNVVDGVPIAIILQYGHGTRQGGYVQGQDYINPAMRPIFNEIDRMVRKAIE